jgi:hypothetical protein
MIESYHRQLRKVTKGKAVFPTDEALLKMLYLVTQDVMLSEPGEFTTGDKFSSSSAFSSPTGSIPSSDRKKHKTIYRPVCRL